MGAQQSSQEGAGTTADDPALLTRKTCYYEVLGVDRDAEDAEIRKAYKKKALELHPDRNYNDEDNATRKFAEVQTAYEVLADPQERAWYDSHRDAILRGDADHDDDGGPQTHYNVRLTTTDEIMNLIGRFNSRVSFNDSPTGFFGILDITFGQLATEETAACEWDGQDPVEYPPFGSAGDDHDSVARPFYAAWSNFSTKKSFSWKDKWRLSDAPDRRVRRAMEKENKKMRDDAVRDFNDAVRSLVAFVKKRDPRYIPNTQSEAERQKILRDSAATQAARARAANQEKMRDKEFVVADWAQSRGEEAEYNDEFATSSEESEVEQFECVVCSKVFKSEKQYEVHEKSKKHVKAVQQLRRQMKKEGHDLDLDIEEPTEGAHQPAAGAEFPETMDEIRENETNPAPRPSPPPRESNQPSDEEDDTAGTSSEDTLDDEYAPRDIVEGRLTSDLGADSLQDDGEEDAGESRLVSKLTEATLEDDGQTASKKVGKAKAKRAKKAATQAQEDTNKCNVCDEVFGSRTQLFKHIKDEDHAQLKSQPARQTGKKGKKSKR
ncbi:DnaJ-domain-containing protein [Cryphonectria parasitica EP155]|uniref:DnaJ-domain-containing protein n=1 Tax=Cryphonectria parasitica (strain ATCC 38755 / EP155) TaxID=660469 RepID=A0A9P5CMY1_CRYP1|nr:DnaJ-domain-containing protein [Cryphonectria parasitica EP155]KAF3763727.1 DnaJ-domain-containing protein [Cryphonectria parasitica EP155]